MKVAVVGQIYEISQIENADRLELATVVCGSAGKWRGVVQKGSFQIGDLTNVFLPDALLPKKDPRWAFMERYHWIVRQARFRGAPSECVIVEPFVPGEIGDDIGEQLGIIKYEKPIPDSAGDTLGDFPSFIPKTDEPNFQAVPEMVEDLIGTPYVVTVKYDGTSCTAYKYDGHFGVCSRNWEKKEGTNLYWSMAKKYDLENILPEGWAVQFEIIGPGIQKNPLALREKEIRVFDLFKIPQRIYPSYYDLRTFCKLRGLPVVRCIEHGFVCSELNEEILRCKAQGKYSNGRDWEGIVIRRDLSSSVLERISFKVINLDYKG